MTFKRAHKVFVVERFACYMPAKQVLAALVERFGLQEERQSGDLDLSSVLYYDPGSSHGGTPGKQWVALHEKTRTQYQEKTADVAITNQRWRLEKLDEGARAFLKAGNYLGAAKLIEQAAKETGGHYTNERKLDHGGEVGVTGGVVFTAPGQHSPEEAPPEEE